MGDKKKKKRKKNVIIKKIRREGMESMEETRRVIERKGIKMDIRKSRREREKIVLEIESVKNKTN